MNFGTSDADKHHVAQKTPPFPFLYFTSEKPYIVQSASSEFEETFAFKFEEVQKSLRSLNGPKTNTAEFQLLMSKCAQGQRSEQVFTFYRKDGHEVTRLLQITPSKHNAKPAIRVDFHLCDSAGLSGGLQASAAQEPAAQKLSRSSPVSILPAA